MVYLSLLGDDNFAIAVNVGLSLRKFTRSPVTDRLCEKLCVSPCGAAISRLLIEVVTLPSHEDVWNWLHHPVGLSARETGMKTKQNKVALCSCIVAIYKLEIAGNILAAE